MQHGERFTATSMTMALMSRVPFPVDTKPSSSPHPHSVWVPLQWVLDLFPPVNWLRHEKAAHLHTNSYTSSAPPTKTDPRLNRGKERHFLTCHAVVRHGLINASILISVQQWNSRDCSPGKVGKWHSKWPLFNFFKVHCGKHLRN